MAAGQKRTVATMNARAPDRFMRRSLLFCMGDKAEQVGQVALAMAQQSLPASPPIGLCRWRAVQDAGVSASDGTPPDLTVLLETCEALCRAEQIEPLRQQGYVLQRPEELQVWLVLDLTDGIVDAWMEAVAATLDALKQEIWRRLRIHVVYHFFWLTHPQAAPRLRAWAEALAVYRDGVPYMAGPINWERVGLAPADWLTHAATALFGLVWGAAPANAMADELTRGRPWVLSVGATAWFAKRPQLMQRLAQIWTGRLGAVLGRAETALELADTPPPTAQEATTELARLVPPMPGSARWGQRRPGLLALNGLVHELKARDARRRQRLLVEQRRARMAWLGQRVAELDANLSALRAATLTPAAGLPQPSGWRQQLDAWFNDAASALQALSETLEASSQAEEQANQKLAQAYTDLEALIAELPGAWLAQIKRQRLDLFGLGPRDRAGGVWPPLAALFKLLWQAVQPWRWQRWIWAYWQDLPERAQRVLSAQAWAATASWRALNDHTVRQFLLAHMQSLRQLINEAERIEAQVQALAAQAARAEPEAPPPWSEPALTAFGEELLGSGEEAAQAFLADTPLIHWPELTEAELSECLHQHWFARLPRVAEMEVGELLAKALPPSERQGWLAQQMRTALPLWPAQELALDQQVETWVLTPTPVGQAAEALLGPAHAAPGGLLWGRTSFDGVMLLRLAPVDLSVEDG
ncbi:MAG: hypothetical protein R3A44_00535 [Caldilineaceae bacterium]